MPEAITLNESQITNLAKEGFINLAHTDLNDRPGLMGQVKKFADKTAMEVPQIFLCDNKLHMAAAIAEYPGGAPKQIILTRNLFDILTPREIVAVIGHEMGHVKHNHSSDYLRGAPYITTGIGLYLGYLATQKLPDNNEPSSRRDFMRVTGKNLLKISAGYYVGNKVGNHVAQQSYLKREIEADDFFAHFDGDRQALASALRKIFKANGAEIDHINIQRIEELER